MTNDTNIFWGNKITRCIYFSPKIKEKKTTKSQWVINQNNTILRVYPHHLMDFLYCC